MTRQASGCSLLVLLFAGLMLAMVVAEGALRWRGGRLPSRPSGTGVVAPLLTYDLLRVSPHPEIVYELRPHVRGLLKGRLLQTNSLGLRGAERRLEKPAKTLRVVGLGDSHMFGTGVAEGQTYLQLLEQRLNSAAQGQRYEVLNFGTPGFNTAQEVATFEHRASAFEPDVLVVHFIGDDASSPRFLAHPQRATSPLLLIELISSLFDPETDVGLDTLVRRSEAPSELVERFADTDLMRGAAGVESSIARLGRMASERDLPVIFMMLGDGAANRAVVRDAAIEAGFHYLNALPGFRAHLGESVEITRELWRGTFFLEDEHPSVTAHRVYAELLSDRLAELGL